MKKYFLLIGVALSSVLLTACDKDEFAVWLVAISS